MNDPKQMVSACIGFALVCVGFMMLAGCGKKVGPPMEIDSSGIPEMETLMDVTQSIVQAAREGRIETLNAEDNSLISVVTRTVMRRDGFAEAIEKRKSGSPRVLSAQRQLRVLLEQVRKFDRDYARTATLIDRKGKWTLVATRTFGPLEDFQEFGHPYEGDDLDEIAKEVATRKEPPSELAMFDFQQLDASLGIQIELPEEWDGQILEAPESWSVAIELPAEYDDPNQVGVVLFNDYSRPREIDSPGYWNSRGNLIRNRCYINPDLGPILTADGNQEASVETGSLIRDLFRIGDITVTCQKLASASDNETVLPYLDAARICSIHRPESEEQIVDLARRIDAEFKFDEDLGFDR